MIEIKDLCLVIDNDTLVTGDFHIGYEEALNRQGVLIPRMQFEDIIKRLQKVLDGKKFKRIIINGDLKHEFGEISRQEWKNSLKLLDLLEKHCEKIILIRGNHDTILGPIAEKKKIEVKESFRIKDVLIVHGHKEVDSDKLDKVNTIIIGHEHPAISIREGLRAERFKCFLFGRYKRKALIVMPSFNPLIEGTDVTKEKTLSPFIKNISSFRIVVITEDSQQLDFGKLKDIISGQK